jgi:DNA-binding NarL/FixJ family response regulator
MLKLSSTRSPAAGSTIIHVPSGASVPRTWRAAPTLLAERARLDVTPSAPPDDGGTEGEALGLTPRELEVLGLLARGLTNREIGDALVISIKTVGIHVSHILRKLDVPTRVDAAAIAHRITSD